MTINSKTWLESSEAFAMFQKGRRNCMFYTERVVLSCPQTLELGSKDLRFLVLKILQSYGNISECDLVFIYGNIVPII